VVADDSDPDLEGGIAISWRCRVDLVVETRLGNYFAL
jgi:hypothetical protein